MEFFNCNLFDEFWNLFFRIFMIQSYLVLTQSYLQVDKLNRILAFDFFDKLGLKINTRNIDQIAEEFKTNQEKTDQKLEQNWHKFQASGQILSTDFDDKKDAREQIMTFYQNYPNPTLLFLGNLENYSIPLQEGLLKFLEEPPNNLFIIILANNSSDILPTILSRTHKILLTNSTVFSFLDAGILEKIGKNLPKISEAVKEIMSGKIPAIDLKKVERNEFDMWLWQIEKCLEEVFRQKNTPKSAQYLGKILEIRKLNSQNLQKKLAWGNLL